jgi:hypothetical protein
MMSYVQLWLLAFALTQAVETPLYTIALGRLGRRPAWPLPTRIALGFLPSLLTHPVVWFVWPRLIDPATDYRLFCVAAEAFAVLVEAALLSLCGLRRALPISLAVNAASAFAGLLSRALCGLP